MVLYVCAVTSAEARTTASLNGEWDFLPVKGKKLDYAQTTGKWPAKKIIVPSYWADSDATMVFGYPEKWKKYDSAWYRREFFVPETMRGGKIVIRFGAVDYESLIFVNDQKVGSHYGAFTPFEVDISSVARYGAMNKIMVGVTNWSAAIKDGLASDWKKRIKEKNRYPTLIAPVGGLTNAVVPNNGGICQDVHLIAYPLIYVKDVYVKPSVRKRKIDIEITIRNESSAVQKVLAEEYVEDNKERLFSFEGQAATIGPKSEKIIRISKAWTSPKLWEPGSPYLYELVTIIKETGNDGIIDKKRTRFGFREFWINGRDFILNGKKIVLRANSDPFYVSYWTNQRRKNYRYNWVSKEGNFHLGVEDNYSRHFKMNVNALRLHTQPAPEIYLEVADEMGMLIIDESMIYGSYKNFDVNNAAFWKECRKQVEEWVRRDRNHPSVVIWSAENETVLSYDYPKKDVINQLLGIGQLIKRLDSTRPVMYSGDSDMQGNAEIINLHYPHSQPSSHILSWLERSEIKLKSYPYTLKKVDKPVYIGEFGWSMDRGHYSASEYRDFIRAYRYSGVAGIAPFIMQERAKKAFAPVALFIKEREEKAMANREMKRTLVVYNDTLAPSELLLLWDVQANGKMLTSGSLPVMIGSGKNKKVPIVFMVPDKSGQIRINGRLYKDKELIFTEEKNYQIIAEKKSGKDHFISPIYTTGKNYISNASFEQGMNGPDDWYNWSEKSLPTYFRDDNIYHSGAYSVGIKNGSGSWVHEMGSIDNEAEKYYVTGWLKANKLAGTSKIAVLWLRQEGLIFKNEVNVRLDFSDIVTGTTEWTKIELEKDIPKTASSARIFLITDMDNGTVWFDDIGFYQK